MCSLLLTKEILLNLYCSTMKHILGIALPFSIAATPLAQLPPHACVTLLACVHHPLGQRPLVMSAGV